MSSAPVSRHGPSKAELFARLPRRERELFYLSLSPQEAEELRWDWSFWQRPAQAEPPGDWSVWLAMAGRGFGKTRLGAEWVRSQMCGPTPTAPGRCRHAALVGQTAADVRDVMVRGVSGILNVHPPAFRPRYIPSLRLLEWPNGAIAHTYSAEEPDQLRGPEHDLAWTDELAKWGNPQDTWDMLQFGMRIGTHPRQLVTTTPRPIPTIREIMDGAKTGETFVTLGSTYDNVGNLAPAFIRRMEAKYEGTRLGRQELHAEMLDDVPGALWTQAMLRRRSIPDSPLSAGIGTDEPIPQMLRIVVAIDPSGSSGEDEGADDIGIIVAGKAVDGACWILEDATCSLGPAGWGQVAVDMYNKWRADAIIGELNYGGAMVEHTIRTVSRMVPYKGVTASRGKHIRAEPVAALYEQGRVRHSRAFPQLEDQLYSMSRTGYLGRGSPDRLDAMVWAVTELMLQESSPLHISAAALENARNRIRR